MYGILTLNNISQRGLARFPHGRYTVGKHIEKPDAILVRSHDLHSMTIAPSVKAVGRAGAGTNNIPVRCAVAARRAGFQRAGCERQRGQGAGACGAADERAQPGAGAALRARAAGRCRRLRGAGRGRQEAVRRHRAAASHAGHRRPGRDRLAGRRNGVEAGHEGARVRSRNHRRRRLAAAVERAQGSQHRGGAEGLRLRHLAPAVAGGDARARRRQAARRHQAGRRAAQLCPRRDRRRGRGRGGTAQRSAEELSVRLPVHRRCCTSAAWWRCRTWARRPPRPRRTARRWSSTSFATIWSTAT